MSKQQKQQSDAAKQQADEPDAAKAKQEKPLEVGGVQGPEPTRYGDWERNGRCTDF